MQNLTATYRKVLVATDFSTHADAALTQAIWLAKQGGAEVTLAHVLPHPDRKSTRLNSSHIPLSRMPSSA